MLLKLHSPIEYSFLENSPVTTDKTDHKEDKSNFMSLPQLLLKHAKPLSKGPISTAVVLTLAFYVFIRRESRLKFVAFFVSLWQ